MKDMIVVGLFLDAEEAKDIKNIERICMVGLRARSLAIKSRKNK